MVLDFFKHHFSFFFSFFWSGGLLDMKFFVCDFCFCKEKSQKAKQNIFQLEQKTVKNIFFVWLFVCLFLSFFLSFGGVLFVFGRVRKKLINVCYDLKS